jgi:Family of unknown function (DUF6193)
MSDQVSAAWDFLAAAAHEDDEANRDPRRSWVPPTLAVLVAAVRATSLTRFYPFTSHARLCFSDGPEWWSGKGQVVPAYVARNRENGYMVSRGGPYDESAAIVLSTEDAKTAAYELERLLEGWPGQPGS